MTIDFFDGLISSEPEKLDKSKVPELLYEVQPGKVVFIYLGNLAVTKSGEYKLFSAATVIPADGIEDFGDVIRVITKPDGCIVDRSHLSDEDGQTGHVERVETWFLGEPGDDQLIPVIGILDNELAFELGAPIIEKQLGVSLDKLPVVEE